MGEGEKQKLGDVRACVQELFRRFLRSRFLRRRGCRTRWGPSAKSSPISRKSAQGLSRLLLLFRSERRCANECRGGSAIVPLCSSVGPAARSSRFPSACAPREVSGSWPNGTADAKSYSCECLRFFGLFLPFRERQSLFLRPLFLKSGQREGLFREK